MCRNGKGLVSKNFTVNNRSRCPFRSPLYPLTRRNQTPGEVVLSLTMVVTAWHAVDVLACLVDLVMHAPYARLCGVSRGRHPGPGTSAGGKRGRGQSRVVHTGSACNPALGPWE